MLITFSGVDGSGKTTLAHALMAQLTSVGINAEYLWWFSANDSFFGRVSERIVKFVESRGHKTLSSRKISRLRVAFQFFVLVDYLLRAWGTSSFLRKNVVCDRYLVDIVVFFATELGYSKTLIIKLIRLSSKVVPKPDVAFLIDVPANVAMRRKSDISSREQHERLRQVYLSAASTDSKTFLVDGSKPLEEVNRFVWLKVRQRLGS